EGGGAGAGGEGRGGGVEGARREAALRDPVHVEAPAVVRRDEPEPGLGRSTAERVGVRRPAVCVQREACGAEGAALARAGDDPQPAAAARQGEPRAVRSLDQDARPATSVDDEACEDLIPAWHASGAREPPAGGDAPCDDDVVARQERHAGRSVWCDREERLAVGGRDDFGPRDAGEGEEHGQPDQAVPRRLDRTPVTVHRPGSLASAGKPDHLAGGYGLRPWTAITMARLSAVLGERRASERQVN